MSYATGGEVPRLTKKHKKWLRILCCIASTIYLVVTTYGIVRSVQATRNK